MKRPPYTKDVMTSPLQAGHKLLLFAGPKAWDAIKWYRDNGAECEHRNAHALLLPPDHTHRAGMYAWPVRRAAVVVVGTGTAENDAELLALFDALQRDGARMIELFPADPSIGAAELEWQLLCIHWGHPFAPPAPAPYREALAA